MSTSPLSVVFHGHFYQPPRDHPWWETVEAQPTAEPYHDWNERVTAECYRAVVAARVPGVGGRIAGIVNTLERISFNFGPTLLEWMEAEAPRTYSAILEADATSRRALGGHGNAMAQAYHHAILPLASGREKITEVRWGVADFRRRFGRDPAGMWLPETAVDAETLDVLAQEGIAFTILAPHQVTQVPRMGMPGLFKTPGGRSVSVFIYDGPLSHGVAFGPLLRSAGTWARDVLRAGGKGDDAKHLISLATDGETYGHHHSFGEMALAAVLEDLGRNPKARVENFASFLARNPATEEVTLTEPSSWSCTHGVDRWRADCGCKMDPSQNTQQEWRSALREGMDWLAGEIHGIYEEEGTPLLGDPWEARNRYGDVAVSAPGSGPEGSLLNTPADMEGTGEAVHPAHASTGPAGWIRELAPKVLTDDEVVRALELLELERQALRLFTSCAWFFDDLAGIEPLQILKYAARALELTGAHRAHLEEGLLERLDLALSNEDPPRTGREIFFEEVRPGIPAPLGIAAGAALWENVSSPDPGPGDGFHRLPVESAQPGFPSPEPLADHPSVPGFRTEALGAGTFQVTHARTGRGWTVETRVYHPSRARIEVGARVAGSEGGFHPVSVVDIPEAYRVRILSAITVGILNGRGVGHSVSRAVPVPGPSAGAGEPSTEDEHHEGRRSQTPYSSLGRALSSSLLGAVHDLDQALEPYPAWPSTGHQEEEPLHLEELVASVRDLAELHSLLDLPIPFDAQTEFWRILNEAPVGAVDALSTLREPLGFTLPI